MCSRAASQHVQIWGSGARCATSAGQVLRPGCLAGRLRSQGHAAMTSPACCRPACSAWELGARLSSAMLSRLLPIRISARCSFMRPTCVPGSAGGAGLQQPAAHCCVCRWRRPAISGTAAALQGTLAGPAGCWLHSLAGGHLLEAHRLPWRRPAPRPDQVLVQPLHDGAVVSLPAAQHSKIQGLRPGLQLPCRHGTWA